MAKLQKLLPAPASPETMTKRQRWSALGLLSAGLLLVTMDMTILLIALPDLIAELQSTATEQLWIVDVYSLILAGLLIPMSALADRIGRRKTLLIGFALFGLMSLLVLFATNSATVIALRAILGVSGAMIMPTTLSIVRSVFQDPEERTRALAIWSIFAGLGAIVGPLVGGGLLEFFSWHAAFLVNVPVAVLVVAAGMLLLPELKDPNPPRWDTLAVVLSIAGMVALVFGIKELAHQGVGHATPWLMLVGGTALMGLFILRYLRSSEPLLDVRLFTRAPFSAGVIVALTTMLAMGGVMLLITQWLQVVAGYTPILAGAALLPFTIGSLIGSPIAPELARCISARAVVTGGLVMSAAGMLLLGVMGTLGELTSYWQFITPMAMVGAGLGSLAIASAIIMGSTPTDKAGNAAAIEESSYELGNVLGVAIIGSVASALYRANINLNGLDAKFVGLAQESLVGALAVARELALPDLAATATTAFNDSLFGAALADGGIMLAAALAVYLMIPKNFDLTALIPGHRPAHLLRQPTNGSNQPVTYLEGIMPIR